MDFFRLEDPQYSVTTRSMIMIFYVAVIFGANYLLKIGPRYHQSFVFVSLLFFFLIVLIQDINGEMYFLYFSNVAFTLMYIVFTVSGLRFNNAVILATSYLFIYICYCFWWSPGSVHSGQLPNLLINSVIAAMAGYILEKNSRKAFIKDYFLEKKNEESKKFNELKDKLLSVVSHDVQSPLNSINSILNLFKQGAISPAESTKFLQKIEHQVAGTIGYVQKILFWTKNQMNGFKINKELIELSTNIDLCIHGFENLAHDKSIKIENHVKQGIEVNIDLEMFDIVLRNLIGNAIKFSPEDTKVEIAFNPSQDWDELTITDHGVGIEQDRLQTLFTFNHTHTSGTKLERGSGIGLSLCSEFMNKLDGELSVESEVGKGSVFYLRFKKTI